MSVSIYIVAQKELSDAELFLVKSYNTLIDNGLSIPQDLKDRLLEIIGEPPSDPWPDGPPHLAHDGFDERYELTTLSVELYLPYEGDVMYDGGAVVKIEDLPPGTKSIRVYAMA